MLDRDLINRPKTMFDLFFNDDFTFGNFNSGIKTNLKETDADYQLDMIVPGLSKDDININIEKDILTISSEKEMSNEDGYVRKEYSYSSFEKKYTLPDGTDVENIQAEHKNGILKIIIPKKENIKIKKQIKIK